MKVRLRAVVLLLPIILAAVFAILLVSMLGSKVQPSMLRVRDLTEVGSKPQIPDLLGDDHYREEYDDSHLRGLAKPFTEYLTLRQEVKTLKEHLSASSRTVNFNADDKSALERYGKALSEAIDHMRAIESEVEAKVGTEGLKWFRSAASATSPLPEDGSPPVTSSSTTDLDEKRGGRSKASDRSGDQPPSAK